MESYQNVSIYLIVTTAILIFLPLLIAIWWKRKNGHIVKTRAFLIGAMGFFVSARVLEMIPHIFCIVLDNPISRFINGNTIAYVLYGIAMAGIFEECGRYLILKFLMKKNRTNVNVIAYGIGHGGIEVWLVILPVAISYLITAQTAITQGPSVAAATFGESMLTTVSSFSIASAALMILERIICMGIHVALTVIVFAGVTMKQKKYLVYAILLHSTLDLFPALNQRGVVPVYLSEAWLAIWLVVIGLYAKRLYSEPLNMQFQV